MLTERVRSSVKCVILIYATSICIYANSSKAIRRGLHHLDSSLTKQNEADHENIKLQSREP